MSEQATPTLVVKSVVKSVCKDAGVRVSGEFTEALNIEVHKLIQRAVKRCEANKRGTLKPHDL